MELADMQDLGSCAERRVGSSPTIRIFHVLINKGINAFFAFMTFGFTNSSFSYQRLLAAVRSIPVLPLSDARRFRGNLYPRPEAVAADI